MEFSVTSPDCPRCGYDQRGMVATWDAEGSCPVDGRCSECGLAFLWRDVLSEKFVRQGRIYELAQQKVALAFVETWLELWRPWMLWRRITMSHPVNRRRLARIGVLGPVLAHVAGCLALSVMLSVERTMMRWAWVKSWWGRPLRDEVLDSATVFWGLGESSWDRGGEPVVFWLVTLVMLALMMLTWRLVPTTLDRCGVLPKHLERVWVYTAASVPGVVIGAMCGLTFLWMVTAWLLHAGVRLEWPEWILKVMIRDRWVWGYVLVWGWLLACQGWAFSRYLKLPRAWAVAGLLSVVSGLALLVGVVLVALARGPL